MAWMRVGLLRTGALRPLEVKPLFSPPAAPVRASIGRGGGDVKPQRIKLLNAAQGSRLCR